MTNPRPPSPPAVSAPRTHSISLLGTVSRAALGFVCLVLWGVSFPTRLFGADAMPAGRPKVLRLAMATDPATLDPVMAMVMQDLIPLFLLHQPVVDWRNGFELFGNGARSWTVSPDGHRFTFHLRPENRFSSGRRVVADDYAYTFEHVSDPNTHCPLQSYASVIRGFDDFVAGRTNHLAGVTAPDPLTLVVECIQPQPTFPFVLALMIGFPLPREESVRGPDPFREHPVGNGPYRLREWRRGRFLTFDQNPYYGGTLTHRFDRIEISIGGDEATHLMMFERGEIDVANTVGSGIPISDLRRLRNNPTWGPQIETRVGVNTYFVELNVERPPLDNPKVRQALNFAINKPRCVFESAQQFTPAGGAIPPSMPGYDRTVTGYPHDPDRARQLLQESGVPLPIRMVLWHLNDQMNRLIATALQDDLRRVGVEIELKEVFGAQLDGIRSEKRQHRHMTLTSWNPVPDPVDILGRRFDGRTVNDEGSMNGSFYNNPEVNRLLGAAESETDAVRRLQHLNQVERLVVADAPWIFLGYRNLFLLRQPWLKGPILEPYGFYRMDRAWVEPSRSTP